jgi:hypothetical protein
MQRIWYSALTYAKIPICSIPQNYEEEKALIGNEQVTNKKERKKEEASIPEASLPWRHAAIVGTQASLKFELPQRLIWGKPPRWGDICWAPSTSSMTRRGVRLRRSRRGGWYVSNISIIFYAPCLFIHHLLCVLLHFVAFLCIFWN